MIVNDGRTLNCQITQQASLLALKQGSASKSLDNLYQPEFIVLKVIYLKCSLTNNNYY